MTTFAEVAVAAPAGHSRTFSYSVPPPLDVSPGQIARVPFGPRTLPGVVFSLPEAPQVPETREIISADTSGPLLTETQLRLAWWMSEYYRCTLFEAAATMLPPGRRLRVKMYYSPVEAQDGARGPEGPRLTAYQERVLAFVRRHRRVAESDLTRALGQGAGAAVKRLCDAGLVARTQRRGSATVGPKYADYIKLPPGGPEGVGDRLAEITRRSPRRAALLSRLMEDGASIAIAEARREYGTSAVNGLLAKELLVKEAVVVDRDPLAGLSVPRAPRVSLTAAQERAASRVRAALDGRGGAGRGFLLYGVTGSGKTEVYLDAVRHCLSRGKKAIVLVPEIALTAQTIERFASRFPGEVAVLHSGLTAGERFDQWWKVRQGQYGVVVGSRGACFAPQPDLGLIVIDEEHEWTYKQHDASPRYHARDVAVRLAALCGAVVVLGSASPDIGSYTGALSGRLRLLRLPDRVAANDGLASRSPVRRRTGAVGEVPLASTEVVDMGVELREGNRGIFSRALLRELALCLRSRAQALLFLNRRGSSSYVQCRTCGHGLKCRGCDIPMTYHRESERMLCHYCGERRTPPATCPQCRADRMAYYGAGTQAVASEVTKRFPAARVQRWDRDAVKHARDHKALLDSFRSGEADVLVGTQMIAKGLHFPAVTLVGVVSADVGLNVPDYRAGERVFQLLYQVAGRSGRGASEGRVIVQTYQPENYAIRAAAAQDYERFYREEVSSREEQGNPPFSNLVRLRYSHTNRALCEREAFRLSESLRRERDSWGYYDVEVLGPTPAHPARVRGHYRWQLNLRGPKPATLLDKVTVPQGWVIDVDPVGLG